MFQRLLPFLINAAVAAGSAALVAWVMRPASGPEKSSPRAPAQAERQVEKPTELPKQGVPLLTGDFVKPKVDLTAPQKAYEVFSECGVLIDKECSTVSEHFLELAKCLEAHKSEGEHYCKLKITKVNSIVIPCASDIPKLCNDVGTGGGRIHKCLLDNSDQVSKACRSALLPSPPNRKAASVK